MEIRHVSTLQTSIWLASICSNFTMFHQQFRVNCAFADLLWVPNISSTSSTSSYQIIEIAKKAHRTVIKQANNSKTVLQVHDRTKSNPLILVWISPDTSNTEYYANLIIHALKNITHFIHSINKTRKQHNSIIRHIFLTKRQSFWCAMACCECFPETSATQNKCRPNSSTNFIGNAARLLVRLVRFTYWIPGTSVAIVPRAPKTIWAHWRGDPWNRSLTSSGKFISLALGWMDI